VKPGNLRLQGAKSGGDTKDEAFIKHFIALCHRTGCFFILANTAQTPLGIRGKICALALQLFIEIHKVFLQKSCFAKTHIFLAYALGHLACVSFYFFTFKILLRRIYL